MDTPTYSSEYSERKLEELLRQLNQYKPLFYGAKLDADEVTAVVMQKQSATTTTATTNVEENEYKSQDENDTISCLIESVERDRNEERLDFLLEQLNQYRFLRTTDKTEQGSSGRFHSSSLDCSNNSESSSSKISIANNENSNIDHIDDSPDAHRSSVRAGDHMHELIKIDSRLKDADSISSIGSRSALETGMRRNGNMNFILRAVDEKKQQRFESIEHIIEDAELHLHYLLNCSSNNEVPERHTYEHHQLLHDEKEQQQFILADSHVIHSTTTHNPTERESLVNLSENLDLLIPGSSANFNNSNTTPSSLKHLKIGSEAESKGSVCLDINRIASANKIIQNVDEVECTNLSCPQNNLYHPFSAVTTDSVTDLIQTRRCHQYNDSNNYRDRFDSSLDLVSHENNITPSRSGRTNHAQCKTQQGEGRPVSVSPSHSQSASWMNVSDINCTKFSYDCNRIMASPDKTVVSIENNQTHRTEKDALAHTTTTTTTNNSTAILTETCINNNNWKTYWSEEHGCEFYHNFVTGEVQWQNPLYKLECVVVVPKDQNDSEYAVVSDFSKTAVKPKGDDEIWNSRINDSAVSVDELSLVRKRKLQRKMLTRKIVRRVIFFVLLLPALVFWSAVHFASKEQAHDFGVKETHAVERIQSGSNNFTIANGTSDVRPVLSRKRIGVVHKGLYRKHAHIVARRQQQLISASQEIESLLSNISTKVSKIEEMQSKLRIRERRLLILTNQLKVLRNEQNYEKLMERKCQYSTKSLDNATIEKIVSTISIILVLESCQKLCTASMKKLEIAESKVALPLTMSFNFNVLLHEIDNMMIMY